jgi:hypothetical protein
MQAVQPLSSRYENAWTDRSVSTLRFHPMKTLVTFGL